MGPRATQRRSSSAASAAALLLALAARGAAVPSSTPDVAPWDEPVAGVVAVTEWEDNGQPTPFGPGGPGWGSPDELVSVMAQALASSGDVRTTGRVVERRDDGTVIGWVRMEVGDAGARCLQATSGWRCETTADQGS